MKVIFEADSTINRNITKFTTHPWNYFSLKPVWNILISSVLNMLGGLAAVWLFSKEMFELILPWVPGMVVLSVVLHIVAFYFYAKMDSKKTAEELNKILK